MNKHGILMCARYAVSPNYFGYCGPNKNPSLIDHIKEGVADSEMVQILAEFETLYPYLKLIAQENQIENVYDTRVVEAYWLGNSLLSSIKNTHYISFLKELLQIEKKMSKKTIPVLKMKLNSMQILPHHAFHVFNIFKKMVKDATFETVNSMDECRIGWGKIIVKSKTYLEVETKPLILVNEKLKYDIKTIKQIKLTYHNIGFISNIKEGDWISFHWSHICDKLTSLQVQNLEYYTQKAINFYNE